MSYKLIIVDDEKIIREGLATIVDWKSIGFEVAAQLKDGRDALAYIERHAVDVVVTDIRMTHVSGLEVARYISENRPEIKVVIISGYKEFEFARQAIQYNVEHYILKPTKIGEITTIFSDLRNRLDQEHTERLQKQQESRYLEEVVPLLKEQFYIDLFMGVLQDEEEINKRMTHIGIAQTECQYCFVSIRMNEYEDYLEKIWKYGRDKFHTAVRNYFQVHMEELQYYPVYRFHDTQQALILMPVREGKLRTAEEAARELEEIRRGFHELFETEIQLEVQHMFESIYDIGTLLRQVPAVSHMPPAPEISEQDIRRMMAQQKLFMSYISAGNIHAMEAMFDVFLNELAGMDFRVIQNFVVDLFALLGNKLKDHGVDIYMATGRRFSYNEILVLSGVQELRLWGKGMLHQINEHLARVGKTTESSMILKVKEYVQQNYSRDISLEDAADMVFLSPTYFSRMFKKQTGDNFIDYVVRQRMEKAKELLGNTSLRTYEISEMVGYKSARYFSRIFKEFTGFTPTEYRGNL